MSFVESIKRILRRSKTAYRTRAILQAGVSTVRSPFNDDEIMRGLERSETMYRDVMKQIFRPKATLKLVTDHPIAYESDDHKVPWGTMRDNTRSPRFVRACESHFGRKIRMADLGCSGGGLVLDFLLEGHDAYGVEGSDYSRKTARAEWRVIPDHLFTGDVTKPFRFTTLAGEPTKLDLITAWEVLEHLEKKDLPAFFANIGENLAPGGIFMGSVACFEDINPIKGAVFHKTVEGEGWWKDLVDRCGFRTIDVSFRQLDFPRGAGVDWDSSKNPGLGFHLVCTKKT